MLLRLKNKNSPPSNVYFVALYRMPKSLVVAITTWFVGGRCAQQGGLGTKRQVGRVSVGSRRQKINADDAFEVNEFHNIPSIMLFIISVFGDEK